MIEHNVTKARKSFFAYGSIGVYQGAISPLSCHSLVETCVMPILLYGCENWLLCYSSLKILNSFLAELCKRVLRLPKWYSNTASMIVMDCLSAKARCLTRKLCFLRRITDSSSDTLSSQTLFALSDDIESVCLIRECLELEEHLNTNFTHPLLISSSDSESDKESRPSPREIKDQIARNDKSLLLEKCSKNQDTRLIADIARIVSWSKLWDLALNDGPKCVNALRAFVHIISYLSHSNRACPICDVNGLDSSLLAHVLSSHVDTSNDASDILDSLWASASIPASDSNAQDSDPDTCSTSSIDSMNAGNDSSTTDPNPSSSPNSDSDTDFS